MIEIIDKSQCCGCYACFNVCPIGCLDMRADDEGFFYPEVNKDNCIDCHKCENVCPILQQSIPLNTLQRAFLVQDKRNDIRMESSSGGAFTAIAEHVLSAGGIVYGVAFSESHEVEHQFTTKIEKLHYFRGSKYVQSNVKDTYKRIKRDLNDGRKVCFSGTPCQVYALKKYLGSDSDNLVTIDIACHGVQSPKLFEEYIDFWKKRTRSQIEKIEFRSKDFGYAGSTMKLTFLDGTKINNGSKLQFIKDVMFSGMSLRPSCYVCKFKTQNRVSDFTLFDCWHTNRYCSEMDDDKGTTSVIVHSAKACQIMEQICHNWKFCEIDVNQLINSDGDMIIESALPSNKRSFFYKDLCSISFDNMIKRYGNAKSPKRMITTVAKPFLAKMGLLSLIKKIVRKESF